MVYFSADIDIGGAPWYTKVFRYDTISFPALFVRNMNMHATFCGDTSSYGIHLCICASFTEPLPMKLRALPQSFWQQPNHTNSLSPGAVYPVLPPLSSLGTARDDVDSVAAGNNVAIILCAQYRSSLLVAVTTRV